MIGSLFAPQHESRTTLREPNTWLHEWVSGGNRTTSGERINSNKALTLSAYYAAIRAISEDVAKLPLLLYRQLDPRGKERMRGHPLYRLLKELPNNENTSMTFRETLTHHAMGWGGGFAEIRRSGGVNGMVDSLWPLDPQTVNVERDSATGAIVYKVTDQVRNREVILPSEDVLHVHGLGFDGLTGYSVARIAKESIGLAVATEKSGAAFFGAGSRPGGVLETPNVMGEQARKNLRASWERMHSGAENQHRTALLEEGVTYKAISIPNEDAQWIESRQFSVEEIARWFRIPPHKIQHLLRSTFSNIEAQNIEYVTDTLMPWLIRWEQEIKRKLLVRPTESDLFVEHLVTSLLRGDQAARSTFYTSRFNIGTLSINDIRELENENPIGPEGDVYFVPLNMQTVEQALQEPEPPPDEPEDEEPDEPDDEDSPDDTEDGDTEEDSERDIEPGPKRNGDVLPKIVAAHLPLMTDAITRLLKLEGDKARRALRRDELTEWAAKFYPDHLGVVRGAIIQPIDAFCAVIWATFAGGDMPERTERAIGASTAGFAQRHVDLSRGSVAIYGDVNRAAFSAERPLDDARTILFDIADVMRSECEIYQTGRQWVKRQKRKLNGKS